MKTLRDLDVVRGVAADAGPVVFRAADPTTDEAAPGLGRLVVRFSPFNTWYEVNSLWEGNFLERTVRGAFKKTMRENRQGVRALFDHGYDPVIGNKVLAQVDDLREDPDSAVLEGDLFDTSYNRDLLPGLQAGAYGSSFRFRVLQESWDDEPDVSDHNPKGIPERTITEVRLFEAGPVTFPANPDATAGVRALSLTDQFYDRVRARGGMVDDLFARATALHAPPPGPRVAATDGTVEPPAGTRAGHSARERRALLYPFLGRSEL